MAASALGIATTLAPDPEMMLLDELTAGMAQSRTSITHRGADRPHPQGRTILMAEHNLLVVQGFQRHHYGAGARAGVGRGDYGRGFSGRPIAAYLGTPGMPEAPMLGKSPD